MNVSQAIQEVLSDPESFMRNFYQSKAKEREAELRSLDLEEMTSEKGTHGWKLPKCTWRDAYKPLTSVANWVTWKRTHPALVKQVKHFGDETCMIPKKILGRVDDAQWAPLIADIKSIENYELLNDVIYSEVRAEAEEKAWEQEGWHQFAEALRRKFQGVFASWTYHGAEHEAAFQAMLKDKEKLGQLFGLYSGTSDTWEETENGAVYLRPQEVVNAIDEQEIADFLWPEDTRQMHLKLESSARKIISRLLEYEEDPDYNAASDYLERRTNNLIQLAEELKASGGKGRVSWPKIPAARLKRIWLDYGKSVSRAAAAGGRGGIVRDVKGLDAIADIVLNNIARLDAATTMMGHTEGDGRAELEDLGFQFTDQEWDDWMSSYFTDESGAWTLSDYGLPKLQHLYGPIFNAETPEAKLEAIDKALNVMHQRSDLAALFVEGGSKTLMDVFNQGGYTSESTNAGNSQIVALVDSILENGDTHSYSCIMTNLPEELAEKIIAWGHLQIKDEDLYQDEDGDCGREKEIHTTVKYGLTAAHPDDRLMDVFKNTEPFEVALAPITLFRNGKFDVVKLDVISPYLRALNRNICAVAECPGDTHPEYCPHVTIAYVKPGTCDRLEGTSPFDDPVRFGVTSIGKEGKFTAKSVIFSSTDGSKREIQLGKGKLTAMAENQDWSPEEMSDFTRQAVRVKSKLRYAEMRKTVRPEKVLILTRPKDNAARKWGGNSGFLVVDYTDDGEQYAWEGRWAHLSSLKHQIREWQMAYGVPLFVDGQPVGLVSHDNPALR